MTAIVILRWLLVGTIAAALASMVRSRAWRTFPLFTAYLILAGIATALHVGMERWPAPNWLRWQYVLVGLRAGCGLEALWRLAAGDKHRWTFAVNVAGFSAAAVYVAIRTTAESPVVRTAQVAQRVEAWIIGMLLIAFMVGMAIGLRPTLRSQHHAGLFSVLMAGHLLVVMAWQVRWVDAVEWSVFNAVYTALAVVCAIGWTIAFQMPKPRLVIALGAIAD